MEAGQGASNLPVLEINTNYKRLEQVEEQYNAFKKKIDLKAIMGEERSMRKVGEVGSEQASGAKSP